MTDDRAALVARAWELAEQGHSVRFVAEKLTVAAGEKVAPTTAWRYIREGREAAVWLRALAIVEARENAAARLDVLTDWLLAERQALGGSALDYVPAILKVEERRAKLLGLDAPTRVSVNDERPPPPVDADTVRAVRAIVEESNRSVSELQTGATTEGDPTSDVHDR